LALVAPGEAVRRDALPFLWPLFRRRSRMRPRRSWREPGGSWAGGWNSGRLSV